jgi:hypothetical protein
MKRPPGDGHADVGFTPVVRAIKAALPVEETNMNGQIHGANGAAIAGSLRSARTCGGNFGITLPGRVVGTLESRCRPDAAPLLVAVSFLEREFPLRGWLPHPASVRIGGPLGTGWCLTTAAHADDEWDPCWCDWAVRVPSVAAG